MSQRLERLLHGCVTRTLGSPFAAVVAILVAAGIALTFDALDEARPFTVVATGALDEPAHFAVTVLLLFAIAPWRSLSRTFVTAALIASVAIDLDHVPLYLGATGVAPQAGARPYTHGLITVLAALLVARLVRRWRAAALGVAVGVALHLVRDICEGPPGVALFWPVSSHEFLGTETEFRGLVAVLALVAIVGAVSRRGMTLSRDATARGGDIPGRHEGSDGKR